MNLKRSGLLVILLAVICMGQHAFAQKTTPPNPSAVFVPMPDDIQCILHGTNTVTATQTGLVWSVDSVDTVSCSITGDSSVKKAIPLDSIKVTAGMLRTKDFGELKVGIIVDTSQGVPRFGSYSIDVRRDKLQSFRDFLQK
jgi:hypothetical protein